VPSTESYKYLGIQLDRSVTLQDHHNKTYKKVCGRMYLLKRLRVKMTQRAALQIYQTMILPLLTYCSITTCSYSNCFKQKLQTIEYRANRIIYNSGNVTKLTPIDNIIKKRLCLQVYDCINNNTCEPLNSYFEILENNTRNKGTLIRLPKANLETYKKSFHFYGAKMFNSLSRECRSAKSKAEFSRLLDKYFT